MEDRSGNEHQKSSSVRQLLRQQRELQEKRKFGLAPLAVDTETHQEISPNIPEFISRAPWYYGASGPTLAHQRKQTADSAAQSSDEVLSDSVNRIVVKGQATHFTVGACKNCGSRTHKTSECFQAKKKVGAVYTNHVTGLDTETQQEVKSYAQKRDRFVGEVGVDLMRAVRQDDDATAGGDATPPAARHRPENVFGALTAQHGGVEVRELPKYLHNLDQHDGLFFDPKTGSMRANPNATDTTKTFQGDLERYRSGDYYNYVESQYRFLTGQSKSFVDFEFDETMQQARAQQQVGQQQGGDDGTAVAAPETAQDVLLRSLYGGGRSAAAPVSGDKAPLAPVTATEETATTASALASFTAAKETAAEPIKRNAPSSVIHVAAGSWVPTRGGHADVFGSYFDPVRFQWGYACCKAVGKAAPGCVDS